LRASCKHIYSKQPADQYHHFWCRLAGPASVKYTIGSVYNSSAFTRRHEYTHPVNTINNSFVFCKLMLIKILQKQGQESSVYNNKWRERNPLLKGVIFGVYAVAQDTILYRQINRLYCPMQHCILFSRFF